MTAAPTGFVASPAGYVPPSRDDLRTHLRAAQAAFAEALAAADVEAPVRTCPGWAVGDLARHLGTVHRWVVGAVREKRPLDLEETGPRDAGELAGWYRSAAADLVAVLDDVPPDAEVWHFGPRPRTAGFWLRRQAHETAVHLVDLRLATGGGPEVSADLAVDAVDEVVTMFFPRQVRLGRAAPLDRSLAAVPDGAAGTRWVLARDGLTPSDDLPDADATVRGPAHLLAGVLWRRVPLDAPGLRVDGDPAAAAAVLAAGVTP